jgi:hypothetical protein
VGKSKAKGIISADDPPAKKKGETKTREQQRNLKKT